MIFSHILFFLAVPQALLPTEYQVFPLVVNLKMFLLQVQFVALFLGTPVHSIFWLQDDVLVLIVLIM